MELLALGLVVYMLSGFARADSQHSLVGPVLQPQPELCFDRYTAGRHHVGDTWERPKDGMIWDCICLGEGRGRISCTVANRCHVDGQSYKIGDKWRKTHEMGRYMLECICLGYSRGEWNCAPVQESCFDRYTAGRHHVGDTWERPKDGMIWDCTCLGKGRGRISCTVANRCHDDGQSYKIGDKWRKPHEMGHYMLECVCLGYNRGEWNCAPLSGSQERCYDSTSRTSHNVGDKWERPHQHWMIVDCTCLGEGQGRISCTSRSRCHDKIIQHSFKIGDRWSRLDSHGHPINCLCIGNNQSEMTCERQSSAVIAHAGSQERCYDSTLRTTHDVGDKWERPHQRWMILDCTCLGEDQVRISCTSRNRCNDNLIQRSFKIGDRWTRLDSHGHLFNCLCIGNNQSEMTCERQSSAIIAHAFEQMCTVGGKQRCVGDHWDELDELGNTKRCTCSGNRCGERNCTPYSTISAVEEMCTVGGKQRCVGDHWDELDELGNTKRCTCSGNGCGERNCTPYSTISDHCLVNEKTYNVNQSFLKQHEEGHMMNCTCLGQSCGCWKCDAMDQCQDKNTQKFYQIGESWTRILQGTRYLCVCHGLGVGEWTCNPQTVMGESIVL